MTWEQLWVVVLNWITTAGLRLLIGLVLLFISFRLVNLIARRIERSADKGKLDKTLARVFA